LYPDLIVDATCCFVAHRWPFLLDLDARVEVLSVLTVAIL